MAPKDGESNTYHPKDAVGSGIYATLITGGAGLTVSAIQNTLTRQNVGAWAIFTRTGGVIGLFGIRSPEPISNSSQLTSYQPSWERPTVLQEMLQQISERKMIVGTQQLQVSLLDQLGVFEVSPSNLR